MVDCGKCALEKDCMEVLEMDGAPGTCPDFITPAQLVVTAEKPKQKPKEKINCRLCMFEIECPAAWIVDGRAETCDQYVEVKGAC